MGLQLGLSLAKLNSIQSNNKHDPDFQMRCKIDVFGQWLREDVKVDSYEEGVRKVSDALATVGEGLLAAKILSEHGMIFQPFCFCWDEAYICDSDLCS